MSFQLLSQTESIARKEHDCIWCREKIQVGEKYSKQTGVFEGDFQANKFHPECLEVSFIYCKHEPEFEPHGYKRGSMEESDL